MPDRSRQTLYEILEVRTDASFDEIEASYRGMLAYLGADSLAMYSMMEDEDLERLRAQVDEAYRTLKDPERRAAYDRSIGRAESSYPTVVVPHSPSDSHVTMAGGASAEPGFPSSATSHRTASVTFGHVVAAGSTSSTAAEVAPPAAAPPPAASPPVAVAPPAAAPTPVATPPAPAAAPVAPAVALVVAPPAIVSAPPPSVALAPLSLVSPLTTFVPATVPPVVAPPAVVTPPLAAPVEPVSPIVSVVVSPVAAPPVTSEPARAPTRPGPEHTPGRLPPAARIFEVGASSTPSPRAPESPLAAILKRPGGSSAPRAVRRLQPKPDFEITPETEYSGALLRRLRESCNATLDDLGEITKVSKRYLRALEDSDFDDLPAAVYVRGFVAEYARALGLDANVVCKSYMAVFKRHKGEGG